MRTLLLTATLTTGAAIATLAQTPPAQPAPKPAMAAAMVTVVGCVTRESATPQTGAGTRGTAAAPQYLLTDQAAATPQTSKSDGTASSGATPTGGQTPARKMYVLVPHDDTIDLSKHVNHTVRVTGASTAPMTTAPLAGRSAEASPVGGATAPAGATGTAFDTSNLPSLAVTTLAMVSANCR